MTNVAQLCEAYMRAEAECDRASDAVNEALEEARTASRSTSASDARLADLRAREMAASGRMLAASDALFAAPATGAHDVLLKLEATVGDSKILHAVIADEWLEKAILAAMTDLRRLSSATGAAAR